LVEEVRYKVIDAGIGRVRDYDSKEIIKGYEEIFLNVLQG